MATETRVLQLLPAYARVPDEWHHLTAALAGYLLGIYEGSIYGAGPTISIAVFWGILAAVMMAFAFLAYGRYFGFALFPVLLVAQDYGSLVAQGKDPVTETWYEAVFGSNALTQHWFYHPNWYYAAILLSVLAWLLAAHKIRRLERSGRLHP